MIETAYWLPFAPFPSSGIVYAIKAYGVPNKRKRVGDLWNGLDG